MALEKEFEVYQRDLPSLLAHEGKFVVVSGETIEGYFEAYEDALKAAYEKFGIKPFLVKRIEAVEQVYLFPRTLDLGFVSAPWQSWNANSKGKESMVYWGETH